MSEFLPSPQQTDYFNFLRAGRGSLVLEACAGAGKSTTLIQGLQFMRGSVLLCAFNKAAALDLKSKAERAEANRKGVFISTMHAAGFGAWRRAVGEAANRRDFVNDRKVADIIDTFIANANTQEQVEELKTLAPFTLKMVSLGKQMLCGVKWKSDNAIIWAKIASHFGTDSELPEGVTIDQAIPFVQNVFGTSADKCREQIDFDDMIWAPLAFNARFYTNDWVMVDEAQDTNPARRELAKRLLRPGGRLIAVGDARQAIYGFTGADADALDLIQKEFNAERLPLSVTYRCPKAVVSYAHNFVPTNHIEAHESAPQGAVRMALSAKDEATGRALPWYRGEVLEATDAILCRFTKPLVSTAFSLIKNGIACRVEGRDIGKGLIQLATRWKVKTLDALEAKLDEWLDREIRKARLKKSESQEQSAVDRRETLQVFIDRCRSKGKDHLECLVAEITNLFADDVTGCTVLATGHKSKGREWNRVFWLQHKEFERPGTQDWQRGQELNIKYVMATRAQGELVLVPVEVQ